MKDTVVNTRFDGSFSCPVLRKLETICSKSGIKSIQYSLKEVRVRADSYFIRIHTIKLKNGASITTEESDDVMYHASVKVNDTVVRVEAFGEILDLGPFIETIYGLYEIDRRFG